MEWVWGVLKIDVLENIDEEIKLYIKDNFFGETFEINNSAFEISLEAGEYLDRFSLVFQPRLKSVEEVELENGFFTYMDNGSDELLIKKIVDSEVIRVNVFNYLGQLIVLKSEGLLDRTITIPLKNVATGPYLVRIETKNGTTVKKVIVE